jgi:hypothetical protein
MYNLGESHEDEEWKSWHFTTKDNPLIDPKEIEGAKKTLSSFAFKQEYEASKVQRQEKIKEYRTETKAEKDSIRQAQIIANAQAQQIFVEKSTAEKEAKKRAKEATQGIIESIKFNIIEWIVSQDQYQKGIICYLALHQETLPFLLYFL